MTTPTAMDVLVTTAGFTEMIRARIAAYEMDLAAYRTRGRHYQEKAATVAAYREALALSRLPRPAIIIEGEIDERPVAQPTVGTVYFLESAGLVKIGFTTNLASRLASIATSSPARPVLLFTEPGTIAIERAYHSRFAAHRSHREWFRLEGALADFIRERTA